MLFINIDVVNPFQVFIIVFLNNWLVFRKYIILFYFPFAGLCVSKVGSNAFATAIPYIDKVISVRWVIAEFSVNMTSQHNNRTQQLQHIQHSTAQHITSHHITTQLKTRQKQTCTAHVHQKTTQCSGTRWGTAQHCTAQNKTTPNIYCTNCTSKDNTAQWNTVQCSSAAVQHSTTTQQHSNTAQQQHNTTWQHNAGIYTIQHNKIN